MEFSRKIMAWVKASRLASQLYICIPLIAGQLYARTAGYELDGWILLWVQAFGLCIQLYIVYANDYADFETDKHNRTYTPFSGGSRVLVDGELSRRALGYAAILFAFLSVCMGALLWIGWGRWLAAVLAGVSVVLLLFYSYRPLKLNYRGGGELLQMIGTGIVLPLFGWYAQAGTIVGFPFAYLVFILPTMLACAIGTSLPDEISDRETRKRSATVLFGQRRAQGVILVLQAVSVVAFFTCFRLGMDAGMAVVGLAAGLALIAQLVFVGGQPGSRKLLGFVSSCIAATLLLTIASAC